jgi:hypothetical protein
MKSIEMKWMFHQKIWKERERERERERENQNECDECEKKRMCVRMWQRVEINERNTFSSFKWETTTWEQPSKWLVLNIHQQHKQHKQTEIINTSMDESIKIKQIN